MLGPGTTPFEIISLFQEILKKIRNPYLFKYFQNPFLFKYFQKTSAFAEKIRFPYLSLEI
jgi:hypothetical protein